MPGAYPPSTAPHPAVGADAPTSSDCGTPEIASSLHGCGPLDTRTPLRSRTGSPVARATPSDSVANHRDSSAVGSVSIAWSASRPLEAYPIRGFGLVSNSLLDMLSRRRFTLIQTCLVQAKGSETSPCCLDQAIMPSPGPPNNCLRISST